MAVPPYDLVYYGRERPLTRLHPLSAPRLAYKSFQSPSMPQIHQYYKPKLQKNWLLLKYAHKI